MKELSVFIDEHGDDTYENRDMMSASGHIYKIIKKRDALRNHLRFGAKKRSKYLEVICSSISQDCAEC